MVILIASAEAHVNITHMKKIYTLYIHTHTYIYEIILLVHISKQYVCTMAKYVLGITLNFPIVIGC